MSYKTFNTIKRIICVAMGIIFAVSIWFGNWLAPIIAIVVAMVIMAVAMMKVKEVINDERTNHIAYKAAQFTFSIATVLLAIAGTILLAINRDNIYVTQGYIGLTLLFTTCGLMVVNRLAYTYYGHKLGGKE